jgi:hypothetical protein
LVHPNAHRNRSHHRHQSSPQKSGNLSLPVCISEPREPCGGAMGFHGFCLPLSLMVTTHQLRTYSDPGSKCSIATNRSNPPPPDRKSLLSSPPHPQSAHASSPCGRRAEARR